MSWFSSRSYDFNAPNRLKLGWMGPKSVVTYDAATGGVEDWTGASVPETVYVSALNLGPATDRHLLLIQDPVPYMHLGVGSPLPRQRQRLRVLSRRQRGGQRVRRGQYDLLAQHV